MTTPNEPIYANSTQYQATAASTSANLGPGGGGTGDFLSHVTIIPATVSPGAVTITDGNGSAITIFAGGTNSLGNLVPFCVPLGAQSGSGPWKITVGANVSVMSFGRFS